MLVRIEPTASSALSFSGISRISLHTHNLTMGTNSALRLFKAPQSSGAFRDMTGFLAIGSVRAGGGTNSYSDFLIVVDARPVDTVIVGKFDALQAVSPYFAECAADEQFEFGLDLLIRGLEAKASQRTNPEGTPAAD